MDTRAGRHAILNVPRFVAEAIIKGAARGKHQLDYVLFKALRNGHLVNLVADISDVVFVEHGLHFVIEIQVRHPPHHLQFFVFGEVIHKDFHHKPVYLRFGQRIGSLLLQWVLCGQHQKRLVKHKRLFTNGHLLFLHRLQKRRLHLGGRPVDLVGQDQVGKYRTLLHHEFSRALIEDHGPNQVGGEQVGRELDTLKIELQYLRQRVDGQGFRQARYAFEQDVAARKQANQQPVHEPVLPHHNIADLGPYLSDLGVVIQKKFKV